MAEVIDLKNRASRGIKVRRARARRRAQAVASALGCGVCPRRCAYCGMTLDDPVSAPGQGPYPFCPGCDGEYRDFLRWEEGLREEREKYWHTERWAGMWRSWLKHMEASEEFRRSAEFLRLIQEAQE